MSQHYSNEKRESDPHALQDLEVFQLTAYEAAENMGDEIWEYMKRPAFSHAGMNSRDRERMLSAMIEELGITGGWYWQSCFPGCLPDGDPVGPFATHAEALADAREGMGGE